MDKGEKKCATYSLLKDLDKTVQKDKRKDRNDSKYNDYRKRRSRSYSRSRSPSPRRKSPKRNSQKRKGTYRKPEVIQIEEEEVDYDIPDRSYGDLYCKACDSHMNSEQMWDAHIRGKRHLKQIKKGEQDKNFEDLNEDPIILPEIRNVKESIVGLQHCCEVRRLQGKPTYQCFLCSASISTSELLIDHVIGLKHRMAFLKEYDFDNYNIILKTDLKKGMIEPVVEEYVQKLEEKRGPGKMLVKIEKQKPKEPWYPPNPKKKAVTSNNRKKPFEDDPFQKKTSSGRIDSYDSEIEELNYEDSDYRSTSGRAREFSRNDNKYDRYSKSPIDGIWQHDRYEEAAYGRMRCVTPPLTSEGNFVRSHDLKSVDTNSSWSKIDQTSGYEDARNILEKRRMADMNQQRTTGGLNSDGLTALMGILKDLPPSLFLELTYNVLKCMSIQEVEAEQLDKVGTLACQLSVQKKLPKVMPEFRNRPAETATSGVIGQGSFYSNSQPEQSSANMIDIQRLLDTYKNKRSESPAKSVYTGPVNYEPAFSTQSSSDRSYSLWGNSSKDSTAIPGLTLETTSQLQNQSDDRYASIRSLWPSNPHNDSFSRY